MCAYQLETRADIDEQSRATRLAAHYAALRLEDVPPRVQEQAGLLLLDFLACLVAGADSEIASISEVVIEAFRGKPEVSVPTRTERVGLLAGVYVNARTANALDFDETFPVGVHFGVGAAAAALAICERDALTREDLLLATIVGYELGARVASAIGPMILIESGKVVGFPQAWGVAVPVSMAAAAAAAKAARLDARSFAQSIVIAGANAPLPAGAKWSSATELPNCKYCDAGWCTVGGVFAMLAARSGTVGFTDLLDGDDGLTRMVDAAHPDPGAFTAGLGEKWLLDDITFKPWPCCRFMHPALTALQELVDTQDVDVARIGRIVVKTNALANSGRFRNADPKTFASVQFSYPHAVAMILLGVAPGPAWFESGLAVRDDVQRIRRMVAFELHPSSADLARSVVDNQMRKMPGGVALEVDGRWIERESDYAAGDPWDERTRLGREFVTGKFLALVKHTGAQQVVSSILESRSNVSLAPVFEVIRGSAGAKAMHAHR